MKNPVKVINNAITTKVKPSKVTRAVGNAVHTTKKHSPLLLTIAGGVGLVATAYFAYKAKPRIDEIVKDMEYKREREERYMELRKKGTSELLEVQIEEMVEIEESGDLDFNTPQYVKELAAAVALPIGVGILSLASIAFSYKIMNGRVLSLTSAVTALTAEAVDKDNRLKARLSAEEYSRVTRPTTDVEAKVLDDKGKEKIISGEAVETGKTLSGIWFSESNEYVKDDHHYNMTWVRTAEQRLETLLSQRGHILLNQVYDELGVERTKEGAILGWSAGDSFQFGTDVIDNLDPRTGVFNPEIYIKWPNPKPIYGDVDLVGRYSVLS